MGFFLTNGKKQMLFQCIKNGNKQLVSNYRTVSLLPICYKISEKIMLDCIYDFLDQNCLLNAKKSGFRSGNSCTYQLIAIILTVFYLTGSSTSAYVVMQTLKRDKFC